VTVYLLGSQESRPKAVRAVSHGVIPRKSRGPIRRGDSRPNRNQFYRWTVAGQMPRSSFFFKRTAIACSISVLAPCARSEELLFAIR
jgi:hypothetical protein